MEIEKIVVAQAEHLEYEISSFLMRKRILRAYLHLSNDVIMDRLYEYMNACRIPVRYMEDSVLFPSGYVLCGKNSTSGEEILPHIYISNKADSKLSGDCNSFQLVVEGAMALDEHEDVIDLDKVPMHLQNSQIRRMFLYAFKAAETEIDIISPWMNRGVVDNRFLQLMENALNRGVKIKILYGLKPDSNEYNLGRSRRSDETAELMRNRFADKSNLLTIKRDNIHYKLVLCDEKYKLEGGYNYLSFIGNYNDADTRREGSPFGKNVEEIRLLRNKYFED